MEKVMKITDDYFNTIEISNEEMKLKEEDGRTTSFKFDNIADVEDIIKALKTIVYANKE